MGNTHLADATVSLPSCTSGDQVADSLPNQDAKRPVKSPVPRHTGNLTSPTSSAAYLAPCCQVLFPSAGSGQHDVIPTLPNNQFTL